MVECSQTNHTEQDFLNGPESIRIDLVKVMLQNEYAYFLINSHPQEYPFQISPESNNGISDIKG